MNDPQLSPNFKLSEFTRSEAAEKYGIANIPNDQQIKNLILWCMNIGEPVRQHFQAPVNITSGFRGPELNALPEIHGSNTSQHSTGEAADFNISGAANADVFSFIKTNLSFDQLIAEKLSKKDGTAGWVHTSFKVDGNRHQVMSYTGDKNGRKIYVPGLQFV